VTEVSTTVSYNCSVPAVLYQSLGFLVLFLDSVVMFLAYKVHPFI
jgi:hypothetical protein